MATKKIAPVKSLGELSTLARKDARYAQLAQIGAANLGCARPTLVASLAYLNMHADETGEKGVVREVNFCRDLVPVSVLP